MADSLRVVGGSAYYDLSVEFSPSTLQLPSTRSEVPPSEDQKIPRSWSVTPLCLILFPRGSRCFIFKESGLKDNACIMFFGP